MITRRQLLTVPMLPAAGALTARRSVSSPRHVPDPLLDAVEFVDDHGWVVTAEDRIAIAALRGTRLAAEAAARVITPATSTPAPRKRPAPRPRRRPR